MQVYSLSAERFRIQRLWTIN